MNRESFVLYTRFYQPICRLSNEQLGRLFRLLFLFNLDKEYEVDDDIMMAFEFFSCGLM